MAVQSMARNASGKKAPKEKSMKKEVWEPFHLNRRLEEKKFFAVILCCLRLRKIR